MAGPVYDYDEYINNLAVNVSRLGPMKAAEKIRYEIHQIKDMNPYDPVDIDAILRKVDNLLFIVKAMECKQLPDADEIAKNYRKALFALTEDWEALKEAHNGKE